MSHSQNSMGYMVVLCIILYIVGVSIYLFVKFVRNWMRRETADSRENIR